MFAQTEHMVGGLTLPARTGEQIAVTLTICVSK